MFIILEDGTFNGTRAAKLWQKGSVEVKGSVFWDVEDLVFDNFSVCDYDGIRGTNSTNFFNDLGRKLFWGDDWQIVF